MQRVVLVSLVLLALAGVAEVAAQANRTTITFVFINDQHARVEPADRNGGVCRDVNNGPCFGGFARVATVFQEEEADPSNGITVFLDAGDQFVGTVWDAIYRGAFAPPFQNYLGIQAMAVGNHEWDYGDDTFANFTQLVDFPIISVNINASAHPILSKTIRPSTIITLNDTRRTQIGVVGYITPDTAFISKPSKSIQFLPIIETVQREVNRLRASGVNIVIGLGHAGYDIDQQVAAAVSGLDLIIGGHSHSFLNTGPAPTLTVLPATATLPARIVNDTAVGPYPTFVTSNVTAGKVVPVVQAYYASRYVGKLTTVWDNSRTNYTLLNSTGYPIILGVNGSSNDVAADPFVLSLIDRLAPPVRSFGNRVVGVLTTDVTSQLDRVRGAEVLGGDLICDGALWYARNQLDLQDSKYGPVVGCIYNTGGIRASLVASTLTYVDILSVLPFGDVIGIKGLTGTQLLAALEWGAGLNGSTIAPIAQVGGIRYGYDPAAPNNTRVRQAQVRNADGTYSDIVPTKIYPIISDTFVTLGGDGYTAIAAGVDILPTGVPLDQAVAEYITANSPISPQIDGRIINCAVQPTSDLCRPRGSAPGAAPGAAPARAPTAAPVTASSATASGGGYTVPY